MKNLSVFILILLMNSFIVAMQESEWRIGSKCAWVANVPHETYSSADLPAFQKAQQEICVEAQRKMELLAKQYIALLKLQHEKTAVTMTINIIPELVPVPNMSEQIDQPQDQQEIIP